MLSSGEAPHLNQGDQCQVGSELCMMRQETWCREGGGTGLSKHIPCFISACLPSLLQVALSSASACHCPHHQQLTFHLGFLLPTPFSFVLFAGLSRNALSFPWIRFLLLFSREWSVYSGQAVWAAHPFWHLAPHSTNESLLGRALFFTDPWPELCRS